jgi:hypothetical protein
LLECSRVVSLDAARCGLMGIEEVASAVGLTNRKLI